MAGFPVISWLVKPFHEADLVEAVERFYAPRGRN
jgi:hypothetical protein